METAARVDLDVVLAVVEVVAVVLGATDADDVLAPAAPAVSAVLALVVVLVFIMFVAVVVSEDACAAAAKGRWSVYALSKTALMHIPARTGNKLRVATAALVRTHCSRVVQVEVLPPNSDHLAVVSLILAHSASRAARTSE
jgi:hypothetical protein